MPLGRSDKGTHAKIMDSYASVLYNMDRKALASKPVLCIGLAQDIQSKLSHLIVLCFPNSREWPVRMFGPVSNLFVSGRL